MRVIYHHRTLADGAEGIHIREMVRALRKRGHEVEVVALVGEETGPRAAKSRWGRVARLMPRALYELAEVAYNRTGRRRILRAAARARPDFLYDRYNSYNFAAVRAARSLGVPCLLEVNAPVAHERIHHTEKNPLVFPRWALSCETKIFRAADHLLAVSTPLRDHLLGLGIPEGRVTVIPNGADPEAFSPGRGGDEVRREKGLGGRTVVGFVGILRPWHGVELLLRAAKGLDAVLLIVGDGPSEEPMKALAAELGVSAVFTGRLSHAEVARHVDAMDVAVSPRATFYASPMKILEYMAMKVPVIAPDMPNIRDLFEPEREGLLFEPESVDALRAQLARVCADARLRASLGEAARARVERDRNWLSNAARIEEIARSLLEQR